MSRHEARSSTTTRKAEARGVLMLHTTTPHAREHWNATLRQIDFGTTVLLSFQTQRLDQLEHLLKMLPC